MERPRGTAWSEPADLETGELTTGRGSKGGTISRRENVGEEVPEENVGEEGSGALRFGRTREERGDGCLPPPA
jgi:hypothetical protein